MLLCQVAASAKIISDAIGLNLRLRETIESMSRDDGIEPAESL
jgi:hypothetical protein